MINLQLLSICISINAVKSEWIDLPQFSDEAKIYRFPTIERTVTFADYDRKLSASDLKNVSRWYSTYRTDSPVKIMPFYDEPRVTLTNININDENEEEVQIESSEQNNFNPTVSTITAETDITSTAESCEKPGNNTQDKDNNGFIDYLPVDLLKRVHNTLKAQPTSLKGKIRFLQSFEKALLSEIESRLTATLAPARKTRASDHDNIGFPSVEGALMIISLLTFAVYLVRLVMAIIWNMHGPNSSQTIFIGRKKRSAGEMNDEMLRILKYIDNSKYNNYYG